MALSYISWEIWLTTAFVTIFIANYFHYKKLATGKAVTFKLSVSFVIVLITTPITLVTFPIFLIFRQIVSLMLNAKYGSKFGGLLDGRDAIYNLESKNPVYVLFIVRYKNRTQNFYDDVKKSIKHTLQTQCKENLKIFGTVRMFMGYSYLLKDEIKLDDCIQKLKTTNFPVEELSKENLLELISESTNVPMPKNDEGSWSVFVGTQPVAWTNNDLTDGTKSYPIILRFHHNFADGKHIIKCVYELFRDKYFKSEGKLKYKHVQKQNTNIQTVSKIGALQWLKKAGSKLMFYAANCYVMCLGFSVLLVNAVLTSSDWNILHGPRPTHKKHLLVNGDETSNYLQIVKKIKKSVPGSTFEDVMLTAIAASFKEYFQKNSKNIPDYIVTEVPSLPLEELLNTDDKPCLRNRLTFSLRKLPIGINTVSLMDTLETIIKEGTFVKNSIEPLANYIFLKTLCSWIPATFLRPLVDITHNYTVLVSNLPGCSEFTIMDGCLIEEWIGWSATRTRTGLGFINTTYNNRLRLTLAVDETLIANRNQAKTILDGVFKNLDKLEREVADITAKSNVNRDL